MAGAVFRTGFSVASNQLISEPQMMIKLSFRVQLNLPSWLLLSLLLLAVPAQSASRKPVRAKHAMVVSAESLATFAGLDILRSGGNAIDAAVAVGFTLAVTYPEAGNIGGGGFMLIRLADGQSTMIDFREKAPMAATRDMYVDSSGNVIPEKSVLGPLASGVPGAVAGLLMALEEYGTKSRAEVLERAIAYAEHGIAVDLRLEESLVGYMSGLEKFPSSTRVFTKNGEPYKEGDIFKQPDLAKTLRAIAKDGHDGFYEGEVADRIVEEMKRSGGIITYDDLESYEAVERTPVFGSYRGFEILSSSPPSAGGTVLLEMLNILEGVDMKGKGAHSSAAVHAFAAAAQQAYADRALYIGDPDFVEIPQQQLISKEYAAQRRKTIQENKATPSTDAPNAGKEEGSHETTHFSIIDQFGNAVSTTVTINSLYGCKTVVDGAGFVLNNEMDDFVSKPMNPDSYELVGFEANAIEPEKRMVSSMTPTIVVKDNLPYLIVGGRGGSRITTAVAQVILNVIDFGMNVQEAVDFGRVHHQWRPDKILYEPFTLPQDVLVNLRAMGYTLEPTSIANGRVEVILREPSTGFLLGAPDPREEGVAAGF